MLTHRIQPIYLIAIVLTLALSRLVPHPPNAVPIAAMALFAGAYFSNRVLAYFVPVLAMLISDILIGFHSTMIYVYTGIVSTVFIGSLISKINILTVGGSAISASLVFYLITNFGAWLHHDMYPQKFSGLMQAYLAGLPFLRNALVANLIFSYLVFYGVNNFIRSKPAIRGS